jgi:hypothetical protein
MVVFLQVFAVAKGNPRKLSGKLTLFVTTEPTTTLHRVLFHMISDAGGFTNVRFSNKLREARFRLWLTEIFLAWLVVLGGCRPRQLARTTPQMDAEPQFWVRVLLLDDVTDCMLKVRSSFAVLDSRTNTTQAYFDRLMVPASVSASGGKIVIAGRPFAGSQATILPGEPHIFNLNGDNYRGKLVLILNPDGDSLDAINIVPLEPYLAGVVGAEMPDYWELAALQAQAIAARTYCLYVKRRFGGKRSWDVTRTAANQVYLGVKAESALGVQAGRRGRRYLPRLLQFDLWRPHREQQERIRRLFHAAGWCALPLLYRSGQTEFLLLAYGSIRQDVRYKQAAGTVPKAKAAWRN